MGRDPRDIQDRTFRFGVSVIALVDRLPDRRSSDGIGRQLLRSGTSIGSHMQEADGAESKKDFIHKVSIAYKEARESRHWLKTLSASTLKDDGQADELFKESDELVRILFTILKNARNSDARPPHTGNS